MPADGDLDDTVRRADSVRWLASRFVGDPVARRDMVAIYAFDHELDRADKVTSNALLAEIRLTWWREVLDEIYERRPVRRHPVAAALAEAVARRRHPRELLESMIEARLDPPADHAAWADSVGGAATVVAARTLDPGVDTEAATAAGRVWGLVQAGADRAEQTEALARAAPLARRVSVPAFPAVACATLARARTPSAFEVRLRLFVAVLRGRI